MPATPDSRFFDVWIVERNTVYQRVPFTVVADWLQEGRLLETDRCRPAGTTVWQKLAEHPLLLAYLPRSEPTHAEDTAEALQEIELDFPGKQKEPEDDDVDMIPLIDISMVLLVFFMMTAQNLMTTSPVKNPPAKSAELAKAQGLLNVTIMDRGANRLEYYVGDSYTANDVLLDPEQCAKKTAAELKIRKDKLVILQADETVPFDKIQELTIKLEREGARIKAKVKHVGAKGSTETGEGGTAP